MNELNKVLRSTSTATIFNTKMVDSVYMNNDGAPHFLQNRIVRAWTAVVAKVKNGPKSQKGGRHKVGPASKLNGVKWEVIV